MTKNIEKRIGKWQAIMRAAFLIVFSGLISGCLLSDKEYAVAYDDALGISLKAWRPRVRPSEIHLWNPILQREMLLEEYNAWRESYWAEMNSTKQRQSVSDEHWNDANAARLQQEEYNGYQQPDDSAKKQSQQNQYANESLDMLRQKAAFGDPDAQYEFGRRLLNGIGVKKNEYGLEWIWKAAQGGNLNAIQTINRLQKKSSSKNGRQKYAASTSKIENNRPPKKKADHVVATPKKEVRIGNNWGAERQVKNPVIPNPTATLPPPVQDEPDFL